MLNQTVYHLQTSILSYFKLKLTLGQGLYLNVVIEIISRQKNPARSGIFNFSNQQNDYKEANPLKVSASFSTLSESEEADA